MKEKRMKRIIDEYIRAYNNMDMENMIKNIHENVEFKNITNGEVNLKLNGIESFKNQIKQAFNLFEKRKMKIIEQKCGNNVVENTVDFTGILALDIPEGPKSGELIKLKSKSVFQFDKGKIISIEDIN